MGLLGPRGGIRSHRDNMKKVKTSREMAAGNETERAIATARDETGRDDVAVASV